MSLKAQLAIGALIGAFFLWPLPALTRWIVAHVPPPVQTSALESPEAEAARRYAAVLAACFNGQSITDGERVIECRPR